MEGSSWAEIRLAAAAAAGFLSILLLIIRFRWQAMLALLTGSLLIGLLAGMPAGEIVRAVHTGVGQSLREVALLVGLGSMLGALMDITGGARVLAEALLARAGEKQAALLLAVSGLLLSVTLYISTAMLVLMPLVCSISRKTGRPVLAYAVPMLAGVLAGCTMLPPSAAPALCAAALGVDQGLMIALGFLCTLFGLAVTGLCWGGFCAGRVPLSAPAQKAEGCRAPHGRVPNARAVMALLLLPLALILLRSAANALPALAFARPWLALCGEPFAALLVTLLAALFWLGYRGGYSLAELEKPMTQSLAATGSILLLLAGAGVLRYMLEYSGLSMLLGRLLAAVRLAAVPAGFLLAAAIRAAIGSSTAAISMTSGILASLPAAAPVSPLYAACTAVAVCAGGTMCSHLNDVGFWLAGSCLEADEKTTLWVWTGLSCVLGLTVFAAAFVISCFA